VAISAVASRDLIRERPANDLVTKMVANRSPRADIERGATARATDFRNTVQQLSGQNETDRDSLSLILSQARLPIPPQGLDRRDHSGGAQGVNGPIPLPPLHRYMGAEIDGAQRRGGAGGVGMSEMTISMIRSRPVASATVAIAAVGAATILGALILQYGLGLQPCPLCLEQRYAYYFAIPLALMVLVGDHVGASRKVLFAALVAIALGMLWNAGLGVYHSGIEWKWWAGPQECTGTLGDLGSAGGLLNKLESFNVVRCDEAAWRFLGLSLAGYNALISFALASIAAWAAAMEWRGGIEHQG